MKCIEANARLVHDVAMRTADAILSVIVVCVEDYEMAHRHIYERVRVGLESYLTRRWRELNRLAILSKDETR